MQEKTNVILLVEGGFDMLEAKTAVGVLKYSNKFNVLYAIDSVTSGKTCFDVVGCGGNIPIVSSVEIAFKMAKESNITIDSLLLGTAPEGGVLPLLWRDIIINSMKNGLHIINPLHKFFNDDAEFKRVSIENSVTMWDVRKPILENRVSTMDANNVKANVILTVGTDCNVGKMTTAIKISDNLKSTGYNSVFVPTGQTGILIEGWGAAIDAFVGDFVAGACESLVLTASSTASNTNDYIIVEGQSSIIHPRYSGLSMSLLHGTLADALILCHHCSRKQIRRCPIPIPPLNEYIHIYQAIAKNVKHCPIVAISLNTAGLNQEEALAEIERVSKETGLPTTDPVRYNSDIITKAIENYFSSN